MYSKSLPDHLAWVAVLYKVKLNNKGHLNLDKNSAYHWWLIIVLADMNKLFPFDEVYIFVFG